MSESVVRSSLQTAWAALSDVQGVAPTVVASAEALIGLREPLITALEALDSSGVVVDVFPGVLHMGEQDSPLGDGATVKMKSLAPSSPGLYALLSGGAVVIIGYPGIPFSVPADAIQARNYVSTKALFTKVPMLEIVYEEEGALDCLRFSFDDLPDKVARPVIKAEA